MPIISIFLAYIRVYVPRIEDDVMVPKVAMRTDRTRRKSDYSILYPASPITVRGTK